MTGPPHLHLPASRRSVLLGGVGALGAAALAACGRSGSAPSPSRRGSSTPGSPYVGDQRMVALAAALENLVVAGYALVLTRATAGAYGTVPPALQAFATTAQAQHRDHAGAWNAVLTKAGKPPVTGTPLSSAQSTVAALTAATTATAVASAAAALELTLAQTCLEAVGAGSEPGLIALAATIAPVEAQHAAVLNLLLGTAPAPHSSLQTGSAVQPGVLTA